MLTDWEIEQVLDEIEAEELQKHAAVGAPIDVVTAFSKACDSEPELVARFYQDHGA